MKNHFAVKILSLAAALLLAGCATHRVDWNARVGSFTYDQAVGELGPPDKSARLSDGQTVADWITRYRSGGSVAMSGGFYNGPAGVNLMQTGPSYYESKLRLTFDTNSVLTKWGKK